MAGIVVGSLSLFVYIFIALFVANKAGNDIKHKSDVILVLGARSYINGEYNPCLKARVDHAVSLYKDGYAPKLLVSGGTDKEDNANESETMKKIAVEQGVAAKDILLEKAATSTYENFTLSKEIMNKNNLHSAIIVTEPFHIARASLVGKKLGFTDNASPATESPCWKQNTYLSRYFLKEPFAILVYKLQNKL
ncbi:YdcF family protein [Candidatus Microgenomates bacterium]|nr:YdcF family protein [Candidatus Microgenomates bacterium]